MLMPEACPHEVADLTSGSGEQLWEPHRQCSAVKASPGTRGRLSSLVSVIGKGESGGSGSSGHQITRAGRHQHPSNTGYVQGQGV